MPMASPLPTTASAPATILVIDDHPTNLTVAFEQLESQGFTVATAKTGVSGLQRARVTRPELILLDVMMPGMDGFETCQRLKADPTTQTIPVIFMTALNEVAAQIKGFQAGGVDYITKPIQIETMLARVKTHLQLHHLNQTLEQQVARRTEELSQTIAHLQNTQQELIQSEKIAVLGQLVASIAHEINTPLGIIQGATANILSAFHTTLQQFPTLWATLSPQQQTDFLALLHAALDQPESLSSQAERQLRQHLQTQLTDQGIAAARPIATQLTLLRINTPTPYASLLRDRQATTILAAACQIVMQYQNASHIQQEVERATKIVFALKTYSHQHQFAEYSWHPLTDGLEVALMLYQNRLKQGVTVHRQEAPKLPPIWCNPDEITQVWVNLIDNALYAMNQQGTLEIVIYAEGDRLIATLTDSGSGIPSDIQNRIFEPFFTTKPRGEGSGLGLDIVQQIMHRHQGEIAMTSAPGQTTFTLSFPLSPDQPTV